MEASFIGIRKGNGVCDFVYDDDIVLPSESPQAVQRALDRLSVGAFGCGMGFAPTEC